MGERQRQKHIHTQTHTHPMETIPTNIQREQYTLSFHIKFLDKFYDNVIVSIEYIVSMYSNAEKSYSCY